MNSSEKTYKLSEFAKLMNVSTKSLQRWDKNGVLVADRTDGCHRSYTQKHIEELKRLQKENGSKLTRVKNFKFKNLKGERFEKLEVIERAEDWIAPNGHRYIQWLCRCDCGNEVVIKGSSLNSGYNKSCGCSQYGNGDTKRMWEEYHNMTPEEALDKVKLMLPVNHTKSNIGNKKSTGKLQDLTDMTFGLWTVKERAETRYYKNGGQAVCWLCECECGNVKSVPGRDLKSGASQSCGCLSSMSWLEYYTKQYLDDHNIRYEYQKKYNDLQGVGGKLLSYDFLILKNNSPYCVIECQGEQHFRPIKKFGGAKQFLKQQIHDKLKMEYAINILGVPVFEILYTCISKHDVYLKLDELFISLG